MGEASVAVSTNDPLALMTNPAHLGAQSRTNFLSYGHNYADWLPQFQLSDLWLRTQAVMAGINLKKIDEDAPPLSVGIGYSRMYLNSGMFIQTIEMGPAETGWFDASESSDQLSIGLNLDSWVRVSGGMTYKRIDSRVSMMGNVKANLFDYGFLIDVPVVEIMAKASGSSFEVMPHLSPFAGVSIGVSKSNLGKEYVTYPGTNQNDPLPRYARAGIGVALGAMFVKDDIVWKPLSFKWTIESGDVLVDRDRKYKTGLGEINIWDQVIMGRANKETLMGKGWEIGALEIVSIRGGRFEQDPERGNRRLKTRGWGVQFAGVPRLLLALDVPLPTEGVASFLLNHINVSYNHCEWTPDDPISPLRNTKFNSVNFTILSVR